MNIMFFVILFPLISFLFLSCTQGRMSKKNVSYIGIFSIFISVIITVLYSITFFYNTSHFLMEKLWTWMVLDRLNIDIGFILDGLSLSMLSMVLYIGLLIHIFSAWYMQSEQGYSRFFAYTNLFIASMLLLVLAENFLLMYLGWEGVSICSYLLIGFYYTNNYNIKCAFKSFLLTRISDVFLIIAFFLIYQKYGTLNFQDVHFFVTVLNIDSLASIDIINMCLLVGVIGKSAQLPLQTWLSDAMVGPTPVSALIHAATMVTAGVYLIARLYFLFLLTPNILYCISWIGILTIFISSISALVQTDIKRILAYSTMSQIGYMFLSLGVQAWNAAIIHLIMHAIFKALLFLSAGSVINSCNHEKNIFRMGGLREHVPFLYMTFLVGGGSLISFPLLTSGFYSKGNILFSVLQSGHWNFFFIGLFCSFLTALYTFRMIFVVFHGKKSISNIIVSKGFQHDFPLFILLIFSTFIGSFLFPPLSFVFPSLCILNNGKFIFEIASSIISIFGVWLAYYLWIQNPYLINQMYQKKISQQIVSFVLKGWGFDFFYNVFFVKLYLYLTKILHIDFINIGMKYLLCMIKMINKILLKHVNGDTRFYIISMIFGIILMFFCILFFILF